MDSSREFPREQPYFRGGTGVAWQRVVNVSLYQAAAAMTAVERWQEAVAENLAAASVPGFKRNTVSFEAVQAGLFSQDGAGPKALFTMPRTAVSTSFTQGDLRPTGSNMDAGIEGKGFFEVQLPSGDSAYTRDGGFRINALGQLTNKQGFPVMGEAGPVQLDRSSTAPITISPTGEISQGAEVRGKLKLVDFEKPEQLLQIGGGLYSTGRSNLQPIEAKSARVLQGVLEGSNVSPVTEMANLVTVMRAFEASQRMMQMHDERMGRAISELGNPN